jgi:hypothetical protein
MSMVTAVKYLAEFAAEALRPWDPSRELAARLLADLPLMQRLRRDDEATADEVTHLVLGRFAAKPPAVEGKDWVAPEVVEPARTTCGSAYVGNVGEFMCDRYAGHYGNHWHSLAEFEWADREVQS